MIPNQLQMADSHQINGGSPSRFAGRVKVHPTTNEMFPYSSQHFDVAVPDGLAPGEYFHCELGYI